MILTDNMRGALLMSIAMVAFTCNDGLVKLVTLDLPVFQTMFLRGIATCLVLLILGLVKRSLTFRLSGADWFWIALRTIGEVLATFAFLLALAQMPIANLSAIMQALPLAVTLVAALTFGDTIGWRRLTAIAIGFLGVIIIVRPGAEGFDGWSLLGVGSMLCVVLRDLATRKISRRVPSMTVALLAALSVTIAAGMMLPFLDWVPVAPSHLRHIGYAAAFLVCGYLTVVMSMRVGDVAYVAPFRYFSLLAAVVLGLFFFDEVPDRWTIIGSIVVVVTGIYTFYRERRVAAEQQVAQG